MIRIIRSFLAKIRAFPSLPNRPALFLVAGIGITLITTGVTAVSLYQMRRDAMAQAQDAARNIVTSLQKDIERTLDIHQLAMRSIAASLGLPSIQQLAPEVRRLAVFSAADNVKTLGSMFATDAEGNVTMSSRSARPSQFNASQRDYFQAQRAGQGAGLYLGKPYAPYTDNDGQPSIALSLRLEDGQGRFSGIVASTLRLGYFHQLFQGSILGEHGTLTLLYTDGTVLMRQPYRQDDIGSTLAVRGRPFLPFAALDHGTYVDTAVLDHIERLYVFQRIGAYPVVVIAGLATGDVYAKWNKRALAIGIVTAVVDALIILLCLLFSRQLRRRLAMERQLQKLAWFDPLTGLPNRAQLGREALRVLTEARRRSRHFAVLFIDLDRFKRINDTQGHAAGDEVLAEVARRLQACIQSEDVIGRLSGDEFLAVLKDCGVNRAAHVAERILRALDEPILVNTRYDTSISLGASIGVALYPHDGQEVDALLRNADMAMYRAKSTGRKRVHFYAAEYEVQARQDLELEIALRRALQNRTLEVAYQPRVDAAGTLQGAEALARWSDEKLGTVPPERFLSIAEESGLVTELDAWVLDEACRRLAAWRAEGVFIPGISVNICAADFQRPDYPGFVARTLAAHGLRPSDLTLEMTERVLFDESADDIRAAFDALHALGVTLSIDDFGTGYSSLSYLHRFPVKELKIDKSFVQGIGSSAMAESLAQTVMNIGNVLRLTVIAEGVETQAQRDFLHAHGCLLYQGYQYSPPLEAGDFARWAKARQGG